MRRRKTSDVLGSALREPHSVIGAVDHSPPGPFGAIGERGAFAPAAHCFGRVSRDCTTATYAHEEGARFRARLIGLINLVTTACRQTMAASRAGSFPNGRDGVAGLASGIGREESPPDIHVRTRPRFA